MVNDSLSDAPPWMLSDEYLRAIQVEWIKRVTPHDERFAPSASLRPGVFRIVLGAMLDDKVPASWPCIPPKKVKAGWQGPIEIGANSHSIRAYIRLKAAVLMMSQFHVNHKLLGLPTAPLASKYMTGKSSFPQARIPEAAQLLHCSAEWLSGSDLCLISSGWPSTSDGDKGAQTRHRHVTIRSFAEDLSSVAELSPDERSSSDERSSFDRDDIRKVLALESQLPPHMTNAPGWLHPFLIWHAHRRALRMRPPRPRLDWSYKAPAFLTKPAIAKKKASRRPS